MNFIPAPSPTYYAPAEYKRLDEDGKVFSFPFDCKFARLTKEQIRALDESTQKVREAGGDAEAHRLASVCKGWRFQQGAGDQAVTKHLDFSAEVVAQLENENPGFVATCMGAYFLSNVAQQAAHYAAKN